MSTIIDEDLILKAVEIDGDSIYSMVLLQIIVLEFDIRCLITVVFFLSCYLIDIVFEDKYL